MGRLVKIAQIKDIGNIFSWGSLNELQRRLKDEDFNFKNEEINHFLIFLNSGDNFYISKIIYPYTVMGSNTNYFKDHELKEDNLRKMIGSQIELANDKKIPFSSTFGAVVNKPTYNIVKEAYVNRGFKVKDL